MGFADRNDEKQRNPPKPKVVARAIVPHAAHPLVWGQRSEPGSREPADGATKVPKEINDDAKRDVGLQIAHT